MSTTATSLVPLSVKSTAETALQGSQSVASALRTTQNIVSSEVASGTNYLKRRVQEAGKTPAKSPLNSTNFSTPPPSPGNFRHPRITEILARESATSISERRVKGAAVNAAVLLFTFIFHDAFCSVVTWLLSWSGFDASQALSTTIVIARLVSCANIVLCLQPVIPYISKKDQITDIPLTPSQRSLLGLDPSVQPTPSPAGSSLSYITPPRYRRSSGSFSGSSQSANGGGLSSTGRRSISANYASSPLSTSRNAIGFSSGTPIRRTAETGSGFSPSPAASPLFHKSLNNQSSQIPDIDFGGITGRSSFGASTGSGLARSQSLRERPRRESLEPASPASRTKSPQIVPGVNYKWLYDKGRALPKSESYGF
ncbi:hypothetical protein PV08_08635 [Exophiala spinifera]|uniref:Nucleoporin POM34 n=1 Tax=Exophiala spinifera TaxID=91928 RepID=A0A0D1ZKU8_9EURO|nr:uncharacterized protein PV08_08635 [Exophiala spinifera]KIW13447.1 hypothetical protein PV08_08635 [Exophiala spinifera]